jgi:6-methylsalicylic acid synthase
LLRAVRPASAVSGEHGGRPAEDFAALPPQERHDRIAAEVAAQIGAVVHLAAGELDMRRPLSHLGLDSVMSLAIRVNLEKRFGLDLPATLLWSRPTGDAVAQFLVDALAPAQD